MIVPYAILDAAIARYLFFSLKILTNLTMLSTLTIPRALIFVRSLMRRRGPLISSHREELSAPYALTQRDFPNLDKFTGRPRLPQVELDQLPPLAFNPYVANT